MDEDDFTGNCHGINYPLVRAARDVFLAKTEVSSDESETQPKDDQSEGNNTHGHYGLC